MLLYPFAIFLSAVLLFQIQPIIAKAILPWFGGSAAVWTTCMLFFQVMLLLGYVYAHLLSTRLTPRWQILVHSSLLIASLFLLPVTPNPRWQPGPADNPVTSLLGALASAVGLPYFLLSTTSPLLQAWFARAQTRTLPYRLFAVSNAASLVGLLAYPFAVEPFVATQAQLGGWSAAYGAVALLLVLAGVRTAKMTSVIPAGHPDAVGSKLAVQFGEKFMWIALPACASTMLLAFTSFLSQDVAPLPFLWIVPLSCYLLTFVICFGRESIYNPRVGRWALVPSFVLMAAVMQGGWDKQLVVMVPLTIGVLLVGCFFCHGELVRLRPATRHLTAYYLAISVGGALGGIFVGLVAPAIFGSYAELPISFVACALLALCLAKGGTATGHIVITTVMIVLTIAQFAVKPALAAGGEKSVRNFYGALRVTAEETPGGPVRKLFHGRILHGVQFVGRDKQAVPTAYYGADSAAGLVLRSLPARPRRVGIVGLGVGTMATYAEAGDYYRFYDINPLVVQLAYREFTFLRDCKARYDVVIGDARLSLEQEPPQHFDFLALDAFSGDSIPVHLLTAEAFQTYFRHLKPGGILAVHTSNLYLNLAQVVASACEPLGKVVRAHASAADPSRQTGVAQWVIVADNAAVFATGDLSRATSLPTGVRRWTDQSSNLLEVLRW
ncbi:MAG TPA: fused MFS/spermidine synthase [Bryobacteraceae bacterium]|nr:fused MFS/spermidine synthase [Bryobacteraceae bacterium]